jgi:hypothetical protein
MRLRSEAPLSSAMMILATLVNFIAYHEGKLK